jgi:predicted metal-dependent hydrolase
MVYSVAVGARTITYTVRRYKQSRNLRISIGRGGKVLVTGPTYVPLRSLHAYVSTKIDWIIESTENNLVVTHSDLHRTDKPHYLSHRSAALELAIKKVAEWNAYYQYPYKRIAVKQLSSRWGSCSSLGQLNFSYRILFLPEELQDYLVVHELCHLQEMNHSKNFWALVEQALPNYKVLRRSLKEI